MYGIRWCIPGHSKSWDATELHAELFTMLRRLASVTSIISHYRTRLRGDYRGRIIRIRYSQQARPPTFLVGSFLYIICEQMAVKDCLLFSPPPRNLAYHQTPELLKMSLLAPTAFASTLRRLFIKLECAHIRYFKWDSL